MQLRISNLAWNNAPEFYERVAAARVRQIELAPTKIWPVLEAVGEGDCREFLRNLALRGLQPVAFQALFFGCAHLQLFQAPEESLHRLQTVMRIAEWLGVRILVFGSPKNRLMIPESVSQVLPVLEKVGKLAERHNCLFCLEPNPPIYGGNWATDLKSTLGALRELNHPAVRLHGDTGAMLANGESAAQLEAAFDQLVSCHISLPGLRPLIQASVEERILLQEIMQVLSKAPHLNSIGLEMTCAESLDSLNANIEFFTSLAV